MTNECTVPLPDEIRQAFTMITGKWKLEILWQLQQRTHRFGELRQAISGITQHMLTTQLRELESDGLVVRKIFAEIPPRVEYSLTDQAIGLAPAMEQLIRWYRGMVAKTKNSQLLE